MMMPRIPAGMTVDVVRAEAVRFRHPLLLIHGLWTGGWIWGRFAAYLAHRGWESWAPSLLTDDFAPDEIQRRHILLEVAHGMPAPPVIITHDAGVWTAIEIAGELRAPAVVAITPWLPSGLGRLRMLLRVLASRVARPETGHALLAGIDGESARLYAESGSFLRSLCFGALPRPALPSPPGLVVAVRADAATSVSFAERYAVRLGWWFDVHESAGHFPMLSEDRDRLADRVHRWIVQTTGRDLLLWDGDDEEDGNEPGEDET